MTTRTLSDGSEVVAPARIIDAAVRAAEARLDGDPVYTYEEAYAKGWASSARGGSLERCEDRFSGDVRVGPGALDAWMDGWLDYAAGREKWHLRDCPDHDTCGQG